MQVLGGVDEPDQRPDPEVAIRIIVSQEYAGWSMGEMSARRGFIVGMKMDGDDAVIRGRLPESEYAPLAAALAAGTPHARLELEDSF
jgi:translation elongation factor EF-G